MLTNQSVQTTWEDNTLKITIQSERRNRKHRRSTTPNKVRFTKVAMQQYYSTFSKSLNLFHMKYRRYDVTRVMNILTMRTGKVIRYSDYSNAEPTDPSSSNTAFIIAIGVIIPLLVTALVVVILWRVKKVRRDSPSVTVSGLEDKAIDT